MSILVLLAVAAFHLVARPAPAIDFRRDIEPIFHQRCYACHGSAQQMSGLRLDREDVAMKGGYSGAAILPGNSGESQLIARLTSDREAGVQSAERTNPGVSSARTNRVLRQATWRTSPGVPCRHSCRHVFLIHAARQFG